MTGCTESRTPVLNRELEETIEKLVPAVEDLLQRITGAASASTEGEGTDLEVAAPLRFPDGIGVGQVVASLFRWRDTVRLDIKIEHNRSFVTPQGTASDRRCFLNDYQASTTIEIGAECIPENFEREVISGISAARDAVQRYNRRNNVPWSQVAVAAK
ncbi:hypothetical protein ACFL3B_06115 [Gemmatimonadota bacterium]